MALLGLQFGVKSANMRVVYDPIAGAGGFYLASVDSDNEWWLLVRFFLDQDLIVRRAMLARSPKSGEETTWQKFRRTLMRGVRPNPSA